MNQNTLTQQILNKITPTPEERQKVNTLSRTIEKKIQTTCQAEGIKAIVRVEGSVAKDTWLSENPDIDIFIRLPTTIPLQNLKDISLRIAKKAAGNAKQIQRYAQHPYLEIFVENYRIDIVPCYNTPPGKWQSATDRTPYHTDYIHTHLTQKLPSEIRLLKKFMQGINVYGAEIKIGGFSGYLCELLVLHYGTFQEVINTFAAYNKRIIIDPENHYNHTKEIEQLFTDPLIIIDPVDKTRNVASAVQPQKLYEFIAATRAYLKAPTQNFFYPPPTHAHTPQTIKKKLTPQNSTYLYITTNAIEAVPDILWGQLYRTKRALRSLLETHKFKVLRDTIWSNQTTLCIFIFELEQHKLPNTKKHIGPQLEKQAECDTFLTKYTTTNTLHTGPYIENGRWNVEIPNKYPTASTLLQEKLSDNGGKNAGTANLVAQTIKQNFKIMTNTEIIKIYTENPDFAVFFTEFLIGKPSWLVPQNI
ncbi:MAG: CCA tRNA nucleotidyltransferase [Nitrososphaerota archaeon]|jgi:tRNA nucleotidyltransferase (CCA-adding enzyme)|nr:CCA tRNA nucleotidyltransferase [Nitrososphaerota archaeon]